MRAMDPDLAGTCITECELSCRAAAVCQDLHDDLRRRRAVFLDESTSLLNYFLVRCLGSLHPRRQAWVSGETNSLCCIFKRGIRRVQVQERADQKKGEQEDVAWVSL